MTTFFEQNLMSSPSPTRNLAEWCASLSTAPLPESVLYEASRHVLDALGAISAGMAQPLVKAAMGLERELNPMPGEVPLFGGSGHWTLTEAASLMAMACHALEMDDGNREGSIHPSTTVVPAALALACQRDLGYLDFLNAVVAGYEVSVSIAEALHPHASRRGFQTTPVAGVIGTAAACATLLKLDSSEIESAMGIAASSSGGLFAYLTGGGNVKKFHPSHAAREGLRAACMARQGAAVGPRGVIEGRSGVLQAFGGLESWDGSLARKRTIPAVVRSYLKPYPCCRHIHPAIDAILELKHSATWKSSDIETVEVETYGAAMPHAELPWNTLEIAQLSFPWVIALACIDGEVSLAGFSDRARMRADVNLLAPRVTVKQTEACDRLYPSYGPARVILRLRSGEILAKEVLDPIGSADIPFEDAALDRKVAEGLRMVFSDEQSAEIISALRRMENWPIRELTNEVSQIE